MRLSVVRTATAVLTLVATAAGAFELPVKGDYGDRCGGARHGYLAVKDARERPEWQEAGMTAAIYFRPSGVEWYTTICTFYSAADLPASMAAQWANSPYAPAKPAKAWSVRAVCNGAPRIPLQDFIVVATVDSDSGLPTIVVIRGSDGATAKLGICPVTSMLLPPR